MTEPAIRVRVARTGGFAGIPLTAEVDSTTVPTDQAAELRRLVGDLEQPMPAQPTPPVPDGFHYAIDVWRGPDHRHLEAADPFLPTPLRALVELVQRLAP